MTSRSLSDTQGLSPRNLKYMRAFAAAWPDQSIVQGPLAQITSPPPPPPRTSGGRDGHR
jgi:hypothetical protein